MNHIHIFKINLHCDVPSGTHSVRDDVRFRARRVRQGLDAGTDEGPQRLVVVGSSGLHDADVLGTREAGRVGQLGSNGDACRTSTDDHDLVGVSRGQRGERAPGCGGHRSTDGGQHLQREDGAGCGSRRGATRECHGEESTRDEKHADTVQAPTQLER